jgi:alkylation response protein AidB-like acyl-CoA dehydrogenase
MEKEILPLDDPRRSQLHSRYGYMRDYEIERFSRDVRVNAVGGGTSEILSEIVGG